MDSTPAKSNIDTKNDVFLHVTPFKCGYFMLFSVSMLVFGVFCGASDGLVDWVFPWLTVKLHLRGVSELFGIRQVSIDRYARISTYYCL